MEFLIYASLVIITLCCLWAIISIPKQYLFKAILIPTMLVVAVSMWYTYNAILGYGTEFKPTKRIIYHAHVEAKQQDRIYVLLTTAGEKEPRLHIYPWSEEMKKQMEKAGEKQGQGIMVVGEIKKKSTSNLINDEEQWVFYEFPPNEWMPKDTLDNEQEMQYTITMKINRKHKGESFESLMKRFRKSVEKSDILNEVKAREHYIKPSTTRKLSREIAKKREKKRRDEQSLKRSRR